MRFPIRASIILFLGFLPLACAPRMARKPIEPVATFVNKVWQVKHSTSVAPGQLYVFLSDGTLVMASAHGRPALGSWTFEDSVLTMVEDGIPYRTDILELSDSAFTIRSHNPGPPVDILLVPADAPPPGAIRAAVSATFQVPHAERGQLYASNGKLSFRACAAGSPTKEVADLPNADAKMPIRDLGAGEPIPAGAQTRIAAYYVAIGVDP
jgi:hypothetical protein